VSELMTSGRRSKYFWPASAITAADMALVYAARESRSPRVPITELIATAVRQTYGQVPVLHLPQVPQTTQDNERQAA
jgi:hypothetical protein